MQKSLLIILFLTLCHLLAGQSYEPQILILTPNETKVGRSLKKEISTINQSLANQPTNKEQSQVYLGSPDFLEQPENVRKMIQSEIEFSKNMDFYSQVSFYTEQYLAYRLFESFPNLLILLSSEKSDKEVLSLKEVSNSEGLQYILNFPTIEFYKKASVKYADIKVQLFDRKGDRILLEKTYTGDWRNPGFEFACQDRTINCTINNALSQALGDVIRLIADNSPTLLRQKQLAFDRYHKLMEVYFTGDIESQLLNEAIPASDSTILLSDCFQTLTDTSQSKFVAFFIKLVAVQNLKQLTESKKDQNVQIISPNDIKDEKFLQEIPQTYAYLVKGVKYNDQWYYEKSNVTYFKPESLNEGKKVYFNNLQNWNFFKKDGAEFNPEFWESELFQKVRDLKKDPDWDKYGNGMWMTDEINNRDYIGLYEIVAKELRAKNSQLNDEFEAYIKERVLEEVFDNLKKSYPDRYATTSINGIICPKDRSMAVVPVLITNKKENKRVSYFFVFKNGQTYQWNYFESSEVPTNFYGPLIVDQIGSLSDWNFSVDNLNDPAFWNNYVLKKTNGAYVYLSEIK